MEKKLTGRKPSEEMAWEKHYFTPEVKEYLNTPYPKTTLWKFMEEKLLEDKEGNTAIVYFGNKIKRSTVIEEVHLWARVLKGMGVKAGDEVALFCPATPESLYVLFAANMIGAISVMPNLFSSDEMAQAALCDARVAFVFEGMENKLAPKLLTDQFEHVVIMGVTRSMAAPLKQVLATHTWLKFRKVRHRHPKYMVMSEAVSRFGNYEGPLEAEPVQGQPSMVFASSGTTLVSTAKLIGMTDGAMIRMFHNALAFNKIGEPFKPGTIAYCYLPPFAATAFFILMLGPLYTNMTVHLDPRLTLDLFTKAMFTVRPQITLVPGPLWEAFFDKVEEMIAEGKHPDLSFLRMPIMGGEGCTPEALTRMHKLMKECGSPVSMTNGYGMTEVFSVATVDYQPSVFDKEHPQRAISAGYPFPGVTVGVFDKDGNELPYGERGEMWIKSPSMMECYYKNEELTNKTIVNGWIRSNDLAEIDETGLVYIYGRMKQHIDAPDGSPVYMFDIANELRQDPAIKDSMASIIKGDVKNPHIVAQVVREEDCEDTDEQVICRLAERMEQYLPKGVKIEGYMIVEGRFKSRLAGKVDHMYYEQLLEGYWLPENGKLKSVSFE